MALHSKKDFSKLCGFASNVLSIYVKRKKVVLSGDYVDDSQEKNREFLKKCQAKNGDTPQPTPSNPIKGVVKEPESPAPDTPNTNKANLFDNDGGYYQLERQKIILENEKKVEEIAILQIKKEKQQGIVIPTDLVKIVFTQHSKSIVSSFHNAADTFLMQIAKKKNLNRNEMAEFRGQLVEVINIAVEDSIKESKKQIKNIIAEYSDKKGVGERT